MTPPHGAWCITKGLQVQEIESNPGDHTSTLNTQKKSHLESEKSAFSCLTVKEVSVGYYNSDIS